MPKGPNEYVTLSLTWSENIVVLTGPICLFHVSQDRIELVTSLVPHVPPSQLHLISSLLPEAILATKEVNEKARIAAFDLLVAMGRKMEQGGVVQRGLINQEDGMDVEVGDMTEGAFEKLSEERTLTLLYCSESQCRRVHHHGRCWVGRVNAPYDQRDDHSAHAPSFRIPRYSVRF